MNKTILVGMFLSISILIVGCQKDMNTYAVELQKQYPNYFIDVTYDSGGTLGFQKKISLYMRDSFVELSPKQQFEILKKIQHEIGDDTIAIQLVDVISGPKDHRLSFDGKELTVNGISYNANGDIISKPDSSSNSNLQVSSPSYREIKSEPDRGGGTRVEYDDGVTEYRAKNGEVLYRIGSNRFKH